MKFGRLLVLFVFFSMFWCGSVSASQYALWSACKNGNLTKVQELTNMGENVNSADQYGRTALMWAAQAGNKEIAEVLLAHGAYVNAKTEKEWTPLLFAVENKRLDVAKVLLINGADANVVVQGWSALLLAVSVGSKEMVALLLKYGADVEAKNNEGWSALVLAAYNGNKELVKVLLEHGADVEAKNNEGWSALKLANYYKNKDIADLLIKYGAKPQKGEEQFGTKLMKALAKGDDEEVMRLINQGEDFEEKDHNGETLLMKAAKMGNQKIVNLLLDKGALVEARDKNGRTAFIHAIDATQKDVAELLLKYGADVNALRFNSDWSPLMSEIYFNKTEMAKFLLAHGANPNFRDQFGGTALIWAVEKGNKELMELLLKYGADVNVNFGVQSYKSKTALAAAARKSDIEVIDWLLLNGAKIKFLSEDWWLVLFVKKLHIKGTVAEDILELWFFFVIVIVMTVYYLYYRRTLLWAAVRGDVERVSYLLITKRDLYVKHRGYVTYALVCAKQYHKTEAEMILQGFLGEIEGTNGSSLNKKFEGKKMYNWEEELDFDIDETFDDEFKNK